jgi:hypothetical protein
MKNITSTPPKDFTNSLDNEQINTFKYQNQIEVIQIEQEDSLWRFISKKNDSPFSAFWIDGETMHAIMSTFHGFDNYQIDVKKHVIRQSLAVIEKWSNLSWRVKVTFKKPVISYKGVAGPQKVLSKDINVLNKYGKLIPAIEYWHGGFNQYVIPDFKNISSDQAKAIATVTHFTHI